MFDFASYEAGIAQAIAEARELRDLLSDHLGGTADPANAFGHDMNNAIAALSSAAQLAKHEATPLDVVNLLLEEYPQRVQSACDGIRVHVQDPELLKKIDALQETTDALFGHLRLAKVQHDHAHPRLVTSPKILGTIGPQGQTGIWL